jgi:hypothetical protein
MVTHNVVMKKELDGVERLKQLPHFYDFLPNPWIAFTIN